MLASLATFAFVTLAWVLFRSDSLATATRFYGRLLDFGAVTAGSPLVKPRYWIHVTLLVLVVRFLPNSLRIVQGELTERAGGGWSRALQWRPAGAWSWCLGVIFGACLLSLSEASEFLYWQF